MGVPIDVQSAILRIADALEKIASTPHKAEAQPLSDTSYAMKVARPAHELGDALQAWMLADGLGHSGALVLRDAIQQATKPETIEWLAAIAERYGFNRP